MTDYLQIYLDESEDELEAIIASLLTLEDEPRDAEALNVAFRLLHTLKGSAGMMGFEGVSELAHELENRFECFRTGERLLDKTTMDVLLECIDFFRAFNASLRRGEQPEGDGRHLIDRMTALEQEIAASSPSDEGVSLLAPRPADRSTESLELEGAYRVRVQFRPGLQLADLKARLIVARLSQIGEIVATDPPIDEIRSVDDLPKFAVIVLCNHNPDEVREIADVDGVESVEIEGSSMLEAAQRDAGTQADSQSAVDRFSPVTEYDESVAVAPRSSDQLEVSEAGASQENEQRTSGADLAESVADAGELAEPSASQPAESESHPDIPNRATEANRPAGEAGRQRIAETVRVDIDRLDRLMNLTGELIVTRARFTQIANEMRSVFRSRSVSNRAKDLSERLKLRLKRIEELSALSGADAAGWGPVLKELEDDLSSLEEQTAIWEEGRRHFAQIVESVDLLTRVSSNLQHGVLETRMVQVAPLFNRFRRVIRDLSQERNKRVQLVIHGENTELDKRMIDELGDPLIHLVRNCIDHGLEPPDERIRMGKPETGTIHLEASHSGNNVFIRVRDDGAGINVERIRRRLLERGLVTASALQDLSEQQVVDFIWHPGFSTAEKVTDVSGRGVGMDVVRTRILDLNGAIEVDTHPGQGTTFTLRLPLTLAIIRSLLVRFRDGVFSIPIDDVGEIVAVPPDAVHSVHNYRTIDVRGSFIPLVQMNDVFEWNTLTHATSPAETERSGPSTVNVVVLRSGENSIGLCVDELLGGSDVVIKSLADNFRDIRGLSGASVMGDGAVCLMLDANALTELAAEHARSRKSAGTMNR